MIPATGPGQGAGFGLALLVLHVLIVIVVALRVIWTRHPPGSSMAWLLLVTVLPGVGLFAYVLIGERPIGRKRAARARAFLASLPEAMRRLAPPPELSDPDILPAPRDGIARLAARATGIPLMAGSALSLHAGADTILRAIMADIERAGACIDMVFYIWAEGGTADEVARAIERAAGRGVRVRLLLDAVGSKVFLKSAWPARLRAAGVELEAALPVSFWRIPFQRIDLRLHRKIVIVDDRIGYTGSMNLVDPRYFKQDAGVGEWVDAMARIEGPGVAALRQVFAFDWSLQTGRSIGESDPASHAARLAVRGPAAVQVVPSGPGTEEHANLRIITEAVNCARRRLVLTTPYFVPDEPLSFALQNAAMRGVEVTLIVPARNDSLLVKYASRWFFDGLLEAGVRILQFDAGLLHTKSITVDDTLALFGTVNLDIRSMRLNFELMLAVHDDAFAAALLELQQGYARDALALDAAAWRARPALERFKEGAAYLAAPLL